MKLNSEYEIIKSQIVAMDPLPSINKAYHIVLHVEKQKQVTSGVSSETAAFMANQRSGNKEPEGGHGSSTENDRGNSYSGEKRDFNKSRGYGKRICCHCREEEHIKDNCFELIGYPDWYKGKKARKGPRIVANVETEGQTGGDRPLDHGNGGD